jgi:hypothetical protein
VKRKRRTTRYSLSFLIDDNENTAFVATLPQRGFGLANGAQREFRERDGAQREFRESELCCGSTVSLNPEDTEKTGVFQRTLIGPVVHVGADAADVIPPSRIGNLDIRLLPGSNNLLATWTAPGGDYDQGSVASYRLVFKIDTNQARHFFFSKGDSTIDAWTRFFAVS